MLLLEKQVSLHISPLDRFSKLVCLFVCGFICLFVCLFAVPSSVQPPALVAESSSQLRVTWSLPLTPNGDIVLYTVFRVERDGSSSSSNGSEIPVASSPSPGTTLVTGLLPFTEYFFLLEACTALGCARSPLSSVTTLESGQLEIRW